MTGGNNVRAPTSVRFAPPGPEENAFFSQGDLGRLSRAINSFMLEMQSELSRRGSGPVSAAPRHAYDQIPQQYQTPGQHWPPKAQFWDQRTASTSDTVRDELQTGFSRQTSPPDSGGSGESLMTQGSQGGLYDPPCVSVPTPDVGSLYLGSSGEAQQPFPSSQAWSGSSPTGSGLAGQQGMSGMKKSWKKSRGASHSTGLSALLQHEPLSPPRVIHEQNDQPFQFDPEFERDLSVLEGHQLPSESFQKQRTIDSQIDDSQSEFGSCYTDWTRQNTPFIGSASGGKGDGNALGQLSNALGLKLTVRGTFLDCDPLGDDEAGKRSLKRSSSADGLLSKTSKTAIEFGDEVEDLNSDCGAGKGGFKRQGTV